MILKQYKSVSPAEAVKVIKSGDYVHLSSVASAPQCLIKAMCDRGKLVSLEMSEFIIFIPKDLLLMQMLSLKAFFI